MKQRSGVDSSSPDRVHLPIFLGACWSRKNIAQDDLGGEEGFVSEEAVHGLKEGGARVGLGHESLPPTDLTRSTICRPSCMERNRIRTLGRKCLISLAAPKP